MKYRGRPAKYNSPEEMQVIIDKYFNECEETGEVPCVTGLAYVLGLERKTLLTYENMLNNDRFNRFDDDVKREFVNTIKRAKDYIQYGYENRMLSGKTNTIASIFTLKNNYGWVDKQEIEQTNKTIEVNLEDE